METTGHFLGTEGWPDGKIFGLLDRAHELKGSPGGNELAGKILAMVFFNPSLRTRASFEAAMLRHGGHAILLEPGRGVWGMETRTGVVMDGDAAEHLVEAAAVIGRYADAVAVRAFPAGEDLEAALADPVIGGFAAHAGVPVINMESARRHPCQGLADAMTIEERLGKRPSGARFVLAWTWHPNPLPTAVPVSAAINAARLGMDVTIAHPPGWELYPGDMEAVRTVAARNGGSVRVSGELDDAVEGADVVYAKSWGRLDLFGDAAAERAARTVHRSWRIDGGRMGRTRQGRGIFLHCLPIRRNVVATDEVLDGPWSVVIDQAENRLHVQRSLLLEVLG
ncbi:MAG: N-acetylornithine carbamoyltransferase [Acidobacteria bacterium]|nr:N-acetylornithine carbamoyltransferase [Acidobacteriota bacterium]